MINLRTGAHAVRGHPLWRPHAEGGVRLRWTHVDRGGGSKTWFFVDVI